VVAVGFGGFVIPFLFEISELWTLNLVFGGFIVAAVGIIRISIVVNREYRCPACNRTVIDYRAENGVPLDPEECPRCGIRLK
jgi:DNA-directed RNA polymerase subunit RPC12/RpoP